MHVKAPPPRDLLSGQSAHALIELYFELNQLKHLYRQGWIRVGVPKDRAETVAEHILNVALLSLFIAENHLEGLDANKVVRMALLHDLAEARAGDITPHDGVSKADKHARERDGFQQLLRKLPNANAYLQLWEEYESGDSPEAKLVRQVDRLEMALQAAVYERSGFGDMGQFLDSARKVMEQPLFQQLIDEIDALRARGPRS